ncbi:ADD domain-containing protein 1 isoform 3-T5 [Cochliomyia hominivorax]
MESTGGSSGSSMTAAAAMPSPSVVADGSKVFCSSLFEATNFEFDPSISEEEKRFYLKAYPTVDVVRERKTHCTVCKIHIGTAPVQENGIKMHPILRVTHCNKCHDFYNSGEFSKGEDGSELYCRWCGQGGEVYCCSSCPYVFCKSCIVKNLSRGVVADIEQNENWNCFSCAPKILWPLRAQHWALMNYIEQQKKEIYAMNLSEQELKLNLSKDRSKCCRLAKSKCGNMSDSMESLDSIASKRSHGSANSAKKPMKHAATPSPQQLNAAKRAKTNDEVVCTPDLLSMLEPDCQITLSSKTNRPMGTPSASTPKIMSIQQPQAGGYGAMSSTPKTTVPPPLVLRNTSVKIRTAAPPPVVRRTIIGPRTPTPGGNGTPVYHTINGYRIDLNSAAQQETFRLPNGKLIQVKRQGPPTPQNPAPSSNNWQQMSSPQQQQQRVIPQTIASRAVQITQHPYNISVQQQQPGQHPQVVRYHNNMIGSTTINQVPHNGTTIQVLNGQMSSGPQQQQAPQQTGPIRPVMVRHVFPDNPIGQARSGLQDQVFNAMEICTHLTNKVQTLTNSNAYKQARNFLEVKELYIHLSYLLTYAIGRFKSLQDKCLGDMRTLGFGNDADCLENGQLAADKQASDDEDNEIEIVEPKTDLITLDSDDDEPTSSAATTPSKTQTPIAQAQIKVNNAYASTNVDVKIKQGTSPVPTTPTSRPVANRTSSLASSTSQTEENMDLMSMAQSFLASMLEVDAQEVPVNSPGSDSSGQKKQPRKKLTNKPNPTLLKQKALMERERLEEMKRNDMKLKMKCSVELKKAEEVFPYAKEMLEARAKEKLEAEEQNKINEQKKLEEEIVTDEKENNEKETLETASEELKNNEKESKAIETSSSSVDNNDAIEKDNSMEISEKDSSVEIIDEIKDAATDQLKQNEKDEENSKEEESADEHEEKLIETETEDILQTTENTEIENKEDKTLKETVETDERLETAVLDNKEETIEIDEQESSKTDDNKSMENLTEEQNEKNITTLIEEEKQISNDEDKEEYKSETDKIETPATNTIEINNKEAIENTDASNEPQTNKELSSVTENLPVKETPNENSATDQVTEPAITETTSTNGNF